MISNQLLRSTSLATCLSLMAFGSASAEMIKIGVLAPLTGATASDGEEFIRGVEWAVEEANAKGGVAGYTFEIEVADVKDHSAANVSSAVERLLGTDGVEVILTGYASLSMFEVDLMAEENMPYIAAGPSPGFAAIVSQDPEAYNCCWSYTASFKGYETDVLPMVQELAEAGAVTIDDKTVAIISSDNPYSKTISEGMKASFSEGGWDVVVDELVPFGEVSDWKVILAKVNQSNPDLVINTDYIPGNSALFLKQFLVDPTDSLMFLQYAPSVPEFVDLTGEQSNGVLYNLINGPLDSPKWPRGQELMQQYRDKFGIESGAYGVGLYEMANMYFAALEKVGDATDHDAIGVAIGETKVATAAGNVEFDPETHVALQSNDHVPVSFWQLWDGERTMVGPDVYSNGEFRLPPWMSGN
ncbi:ABC transporter substrate-binding protein [Ruegeria sp.]|uniref:ABC transporter substrate-binding protein n=1 Tax=Ruegeria sp. TaxID=1879320 RepID=UPI00231444DB|nr:ABC transporter substrate-binding protein [Ruegeria sp.]MDA7966250.1 ABC transporter substrate-binding protein [Ruegeria sp.]